MVSLNNEANNKSNTLRDETYNISNGDYGQTAFMWFAFNSVFAVVMSVTTFACYQLPAFKKNCESDQQDPNKCVKSDSSGYSVLWLMPIILCTLLFGVGYMKTSLPFFSPNFIRKSLFRYIPVANKHGNSVLKLRTTNYTWAMLAVLIIQTLLITVMSETVIDERCNSASILKATEAQLANPVTRTLGRLAYGAQNNWGFDIVNFYSVFNPRYWLWFSLAFAIYYSYRAMTPAQKRTNVEIAAPAEDMAAARKETKNEKNNTFWKGFVHTFWDGGASANTMEENGPVGQKGKKTMMSAPVEGVQAASIATGVPLVEGKPVPKSRKGVQAARKETKNGKNKKISFWDRLSNPDSGAWANTMEENGPVGQKGKKTMMSAPVENVVQADKQITNKNETKGGSTSSNTNRVASTRNKIRKVTTKGANGARYLMKKGHNLTTKGVASTRNKIKKFTTKTANGSRYMMKKRRNLTTKGVASTRNKIKKFTTKAANGSRYMMKKGRNLTTKAVASTRNKIRKVTTKGAKGFRNKIRKLTTKAPALPAPAPAPAPADENNLPLIPRSPLRETKREKGFVAPR
jgi:hypothetical protein